MALSQKTTVEECDCCKLLKTAINKQTDMDRKISEISHQNRNLEKKIDLLVGSSDKCSEGRKPVSECSLNRNKSSLNQSECSNYYQVNFA